MTILLTFTDGQQFFTHFQGNSKDALHYYESHNIEADCSVPRVASIHFPSHRLIFALKGQASKQALLKA